MGHGFVTHRSQNCLSYMLKNRLEGEFLKGGVTNSGNRKGVLEMVETCFRQLPALPVPSIQAVSHVGWSIKEESRAESTSLVERNRNQFLKDSIPGLEPTAQYTTAKDPTRRTCFF
jgi:hypothetical protein